MARITVVVFSHIAKDPRVLRHVDALLPDHEVTTIAYGKFERQGVRHIQIPDRLSYLPTRPHLIVALLLRRYEWALSRIGAIRFVRHVLSNGKQDLIFTNDAMPLGAMIPSSVWVHADLHEYAPREMEEDWRFRLLLQKLYVHICGSRLPHCASVSTVSDGLANEFGLEFGVFPTVIRNVPAYSLSQTPWLPASRPLRLVHTGLAARARRLENMVRAVDSLEDVQLDLYLVRAPRQRTYFRKLSREIERSSNATLYPPVPMGEIPDLMAQYDAGLLVIYPSSFTLLHCLPNKLFDCMAASRAVVVGPSPDMAAFVDENDVGVVAQGFSPDEIREAIQSLDGRMLERFSNNARRVSLTITVGLEGEKLRSLVRQSLLDMGK